MIGHRGPIAVDASPSYISIAFRSSIGHHQLPNGKTDVATIANFEISP
ncbi:MAG: hypothetical protein AAGH78_15295 [Cyanobacteria bacterium P01_H01_bin.58]